MQRLVCVAVVWAASAEAHAQACPDAVSGWVADASEASGVRMEAVACPPGMARVRLFPEGARPIDVEVAETEGPSFRRAGRLRTSPIVDVPDYGTLPEAQRDAYDALVRWLAENDARVRFGAGPAALREATELSGPGLRDAGWWLLGAAVLLAAMALALARPGAFEWREPLVLLGVGLAARVGFGVWGPLHVNGQGPLWIRGALEDPGMLASYGPGYPELFGPIARALTPDSAIFATNAALSALIPVVVYGIARAHELDRNRALLAALLLTLDPVSIRFATSESYFTPVVFLVSAAALGSSLSGDRPKKGIQACR